MRTSMAVLLIALAITLITLLVVKLLLDDIGLLVGVLVYVRHLANQHGIGGR
ncbi:hypothetical protein ACGFI4_04640 [Micromonospora carbonacea]|uniref:hypothetical protein n=1 Tax=Micromonospora TaxID=1873 RepID=UPI00370FC160